MFRPTNPRENRVIQDVERFPSSLVAEQSFLNESRRSVVFKQLFIRLLSAVGLLIAVPSQAVLPGELDLTFNGNGKVTTDFATSDDYSEAVAIQADGKIVVVGHSKNGSNSDFALARYNSNGSLDTRFDTDGKVTTAFGTGNDQGNAVAIQADGKIVVAGISKNGSNYDFALARYNSNGSLDTTFGTGGKVTTAFGTGTDWGSAVALQTDGKIVVVGFSRNGDNFNFALARYNTNGSLDTTFGTGGKVTTAFGTSYDKGYAVAIQADGKIVVAGSSDNGSNDDFALARYNSDGSLDTTFGTGGKVTTDFGTGGDEGFAVAIQADGKIVIAGVSYNGSNDDLALARYNSNGSLDTRFDTDGKVTTDFGTDYDSGSAMALQADGKIVVVGHSKNGSNYDFALARYIGTATPPLVPSGLTATPVSSSQINLAWTDNSGDETGFKVESPARTLIHTTAANATSYNHTGLTCNTTYNYQVKATNAAGDSTAVTASATTAACSSTHVPPDSFFLPKPTMGRNLVTATVKQSGESTKARMSLRALCRMPIHTTQAWFSP